jgi:hypothetical protein
MDAQTILTAAGTGFIAAILALPIQSLVANSKAMKTLSVVYADIIASLRKEIKEVRDEVEKLKPLRCDNLVCRNRRPPRMDQITNTENNETNS